MSGLIKLVAVVADEKSRWAWPPPLILAIVGVIGRVLTEVGVWPNPVLVLLLSIQVLLMLTVFSALTLCLLVGVA
jgi:hypothetical protein